MIIPKLVLALEKVLALSILKWRINGRKLKIKFSRLVRFIF